MMTTQTPPDARRRPSARTLLPAFLLLWPILPACTSGPEPEPLPLPDAGPIAEQVRQAQKDWPWIAGTEWELASIDGRAPVEGVRVWISFKPEETWVTGSAGCNRFTGGYIRRGRDGIRVRDLLVTERFCESPSGVMQQEARFLHLLAEAAAYDASSDWFHLLDTDERVILSFTASAREP